MGLLIKNKRTSFLKEVNWNIANFTYDTIVFRVNIYEAQEEIDIKFSNDAVYVESTKFESFENILRNPVYVTVTKENIKDRITVDLRHLNLVVEGDFLVTFEYVKISGSGEFLYRCSDPVFMTRHFVRWSRLFYWRVEWGPGPSIWALVDVEK
ncbi:MAG: hypothetical protein FWH18_11850 [Marinilabiliaceae bacterium]|nr:hypothetical protein [Marinilabiliaceae bacterium]